MTTHINTANAISAAENSLQKAFTQKSAKPDTLGKDDFLKLLMAQITHQNPLNPMDSQGMMDQLTGMGSLEQLISINESLGKLNKTQAEIVRANTFAFLDKDVKIRGQTVELNRGQTSGIQFQIPREAAKVKLTVIGAEGQAVRSMDLGAYAAGIHAVRWDGLDMQGNRAPDGKYRYQIVAKGPENQQLQVELFRQGKVSGVKFGAGSPKLNIGGEDIDLRDVIEMSNRSERIFGDRLPANLRQDIRSRPPVTNRRR
ncbi:MAG: flagellar hook assembly protein FlgD [bacterium]